MPAIELIRGHSFIGGPERYGHVSSCATGIRDPGPGIRRGRGTHYKRRMSGSGRTGPRTPDSGPRTADPGPRIQPWTSPRHAAQARGDPDASIDDIRIEMGRLRGNDEVDRFLVRHRLPVTAAGGHGVGDVHRGTSLALPSVCTIGTARGWRTQSRAPASVPLNVSAYPRTTRPSRSALASVSSHGEG